jgi:hypothetical protein
VIVRAEASDPTVAAAASVAVPAVDAASSAPATVPRSIAPRPAFLGGMVFIAVLSLGFVYDWKKGVFGWQ